MTQLVIEIDRLTPFVFDMLSVDWPILPDGIQLYYSLQVRHLYCITIQLFGVSEMLCAWMQMNGKHFRQYFVLIQ